MTEQTGRAEGQEPGGGPGGAQPGGVPGGARPGAVETETDAAAETAAAETAAAETAAAETAAAAPRRGVERELKYRLADAEHAARYAAAKPLAGLLPKGRPRQVQVEDRYLDTEDERLASAGYAVRLRRGATGVLVSVKSTAKGAAGDSVALHRREEVEGPASASFEPHAWPASEARDLVILHAGGEPLVEIATIRQVRRVRLLADAASEVELSVDDVEVVRSGNVIDRFLELEAELRRGDEAALTALAGVFETDAGLEPVAVSKLERALAAAARAARSKRPKVPKVPKLPKPPKAPEAAGPQIPSPAGSALQIPAPAGSALQIPAPAGSAVAMPAVSAPAEPEPPKLIVGKTPGVTADDILAEAGRKVLRFHLARMFAREAGTRTGEQIEDLHGMRVATRRMRAAWRVFGDAFNPKRTRRLRDQLREVATRLGAVRDLDVLIEGLEAYQADVAGAAGPDLQPLIDAWAADREAARLLMLRALDTRWYARFTEEFRVFVSTEGAGAVAHASPVTPRHVRDTAGSRIWLAYEQVRGYEPVLRWADVETLHELRIAAKWLRYTMEFFREGMGIEVEQLVARVVALQDHLGWLHDADVSIALTRQFLVERSSMLTEPQADAISDYLRSRERELERLRRSVAVPWRSVSGIAFRRLLGRAVSAL